MAALGNQYKVDGYAHYNCGDGFPGIYTYKNIKSCSLCHLYITGLWDFLFCFNEHLKRKVLFRGTKKSFEIHKECCKLYIKWGWKFSRQAAKELK